MIQTYNASSSGSAALKEERKDTLTGGDVQEASSVQPSTTSVRERIAANSYKPFTDPSVDKRVLRRQKFEGQV